MGQNLSRSISRELKYRSNSSMGDNYNSFLFALSRLFLLRLGWNYGDPHEDFGEIPLLTPVSSAILTTLPRRSFESTYESASTIISRDSYNVNRLPLFRPVPINSLGITIEPTRLWNSSNSAATIDPRYPISQITSIVSRVIWIFRRIELRKRERERERER